MSFKAATPQLARQRWLEIARVAHPDGSAPDRDWYDTAREAYRIVRKALEHCRGCGGAGVVEQFSNFAMRRVTCPLCKGKGSL